MQLTSHGLYRRCEDNELDQHEQIAELEPQTTNGNPQPRSSGAGHEDDGETEEQDIPPEDGEPAVFWMLVPTPTEEALFAEIGEPFVEPTKRNFAQIAAGEGRRKR